METQNKAALVEGLLEIYWQYGGALECGRIARTTLINEYGLTEFLCMFDKYVQRMKQRQ